MAANALRRWVMSAGQQLAESPQALASGSSSSRKNCSLTVALNWAKRQPRAFRLAHPAQRLDGAFVDGAARRAGIEQAANGAFYKAFLERGFYC